MILGERKKKIWINNSKWKIKKIIHNSRFVNKTLFLFLFFVFAHRWLGTLGCRLNEFRWMPTISAAFSSAYSIAKNCRCTVVHCEQINKRSLCRVYALCIVHISVSIAFIWLRHILRMYRERGMDRHGMKKKRRANCGPSAAKPFVIWHYGKERWRRGSARPIRHSATN